MSTIKTKHRTPYLKLSSWGDRFVTLPLALLAVAFVAVVVAVVVVVVIVVVVVVLLVCRSVIRGVVALCVRGR